AVLVNFWTYTCINSLRPLPYVRAWAKNYGQRGLVVIGVHTPEFAVERDLVNVRDATAAEGIAYAVALDNDHQIWLALANQAWPAFYCVDGHGRLRDCAFGEGGYARSERLIQRLLHEANGVRVGDPIASVRGLGTQAEADFANLRSPETYLGYARA